MEKSNHQKKSMGLLSATSIGVGAMIGAGIFALLGIAVKMAGQMAYLSFIFAGIIAFLTAYSVSKLAVTFPSKGGRVTFLKEGLGRGVLSGGLNISMWVGYVIVTSLYARAFGEYGVALMGKPDNDIWLYILSSTIILIFVVINFFGASAVGKSELFVVGVKVIVLLVFGIAGFFTIELQRITPRIEFNIANIILAGGIVFMSYEGFGLVANTAEDISRPGKNLPRALFLSVAVVIVIYSLVALTVIGNMEVSEIIDAKEYVLAEAARPIIGSTGFTIMAIAALFSTASAINATIYGPVYMLQETAKIKQLPQLFTKKFLNHQSGYSLLITGSLVLIITNTLSLKRIAETGSLIFLLIYAAVNIANLRLHKKTNSKKWIIVCGIAGTVFAFGALLYYLTDEGNISVYVFTCIIAVGFAFQWIYQTFRKR